MDKINPRVIAAVDLARAKAADTLAAMEAAERSSSTIGDSTSWKISRQRALKELRGQVKSWETILNLVEWADSEDDVDADNEFPA